MSIIKEFASPEAWRVVHASSEEKARIARADQEIMAYGKPHNWPICVYEKDVKKLTRKPARQVCSQVNLYTVIDDDSKLTRAVIRYTLQANGSIAGSEPKNFKDFLALGDKPLDRDLIEQRQISAIDNEFGKLLPLLRGGQSLNEEQVAVVLRFITFARFRTPTWRRVYLPEFNMSPLEKYKTHIVGLFRSVKDRGQAWKKDLDTLNAAFDNYFYQMTMTNACSKHIDGLRRAGAKIVVLHADKTTPFITCDNPARPYFSDKLRRILLEPLPSVLNAKVQITYPIGPTACLSISLDSSAPPCVHENVKGKQVKRINTALALMADKEIIFAGPKISVFEDWLDLNELQPARRP
jgi:hypothetical protein